MPRLRSAARILAFWLTVWTGFSAVRVLVRIVMLPASHPATWLMIARTVLAQAPWIVASPLIVMAGARLLGHPWHRVLPMHIGGAMLVAVIDAAWSHAALRAAGVPLAMGATDWFLGRVEQSLVLYACLASAGAAARHWARLRELRRRDARLETQLLRARLDALTAQLQPHFLFNTLNSVSELVHQDPRQAAAMLAALRRLLDRVLSDDARQEVTLSEELELLQAYVDIQQMRFAGSLAVQASVDPELAQVLVPRLMLQPLVENAIRHGASGHRGTTRVTIVARACADGLEICVRDQGPGPASVPVVEGIGLGNTRARLRELHADKASLTLRPGRDGGAETIVRLPMRDTSPMTVPGSATPELPVTNAPDRIEAAWSRGRLASLIGTAWITLSAFGALCDVLAASGGMHAWEVAFLSRLLEGAVWLLLGAPVVGLAMVLTRVTWPRWLVYTGLVPVGAATAWLHVMVVALVTPMSRADQAALLLYDLAAFAVITTASHAWALHALMITRQRQAIDLERSIVGERLRALQCRLPPGLVDGALARIAALALTSPAEADRLTGRFGDQLRRLLEREPPSAVPA